MSVLALTSAIGIASALPAGLAMPFTQFAWVKGNNEATFDSTLFGVVTEGVTTDQSFRVYHTATPAIAALQRTTGHTAITGGATDGTWQLVISRHISATEHRLWVDGTEYGGTIGARSPSGYNQLVVTRHGPGTGTDPNARVAHVGWLARDITTQETTDLNAGGNPINIFGADLVAYLPANDEATWLYDPVRESNWTNGARTYSSDNPTVDAPGPAAGVLSLQPLYYGATLLANKTNINWAVTEGHSGILGLTLGSGTTGTTNGEGVFVPNGTNDFGVANDPVTLHLYWEEGTNPIVDRSLIVKTTLVAEA